jgi:hypothetical protein
MHLYFMKLPQVSVRDALHPTSESKRGLRSFYEEWPTMLPVCQQFNDTRCRKIVLFNRLHPIDFP